jgi:hypothetical protein
LAERVGEVKEGSIGSREAEGAISVGDGVLGLIIVIFGRLQADIAKRETIKINVTRGRWRQKSTRLWLTITAHPLNAPINVQACPVVKFFILK